MKETDIIKAIRTHLRSCPEQRNGVFESDAEVVEFGGRLLAFTTDDFSAEDLMSVEAPQLLGRNLAIATMSDLLAVGATPEFMMQSLVVCPEMDREALEDVSRGIQEALDEFGAVMLGGDVGLGEEWRYTGFAIGSFVDGAISMSRKIPVDNGLIVATGDFGDANGAAVTGSGDLRFECRLDQSKRLAASPAACIDTSDGLARAIETIWELNPRIRFILDIDAIPYAPGVKALAESLSVRPEAMLFGSAGEYELVAFVSEPHGRELLAGGGFTAIGAFSSDSPQGLYYRTAGKDGLIPHIAVPDPRQMGDFEQYRDAIVALTRRLFG